MTIQKQDRDNIHRPDDGIDAALQRELDEALGDMSIEDLLDAETPAETTPRPDGVRAGKVIDIQGDDIFVDFGGKSQGILPAAQFEDEPLPEIGSAVEVTIEGYDPADGLLLLSRQGAVLAATWDTLEVGQVVEAFVTGHNKGGLELKFGGIDGFMPVSLIDLSRTEEMAPFVNTKLRCEVIEIDRRRESVTLSRRAVLQREAEASRTETLATLAEGKVVRGVVRSIMPYGAFVDIGGIDGLLHISDMSHRRIADPREVVTEGQPIEVMILRVDRDEERISLGLKQALPDPWTGVEAKWPVDEVVIGRVSRLADFGAFVELEEGVEGLVPISELSFERRIRHPGDVLKEGDTVQVRVLSVDPAAKRISLSVKRVGDDPWTGASVRWPVGSTVQGVVTKLADFGAFIELASGVEGLVHISELDENRVRNVNEVVREGQSVQAKVLEIDEDRRRISLSVKAIKLDPNYTGEAGDAPEAEQPTPGKERKRPMRGGLDGPNWLDLLSR
ncbi:MAG TPA: S1 RNA-binding domain-containing protein [Phycisphaerae bacterium]|nr:S1 RNA-binding domain-containing protein [Phycisphaerae bacterium]